MSWLHSRTRFDVMLRSVGPVWFVSTSCFHWIEGIRISVAVANAYPFVFVAFCRGTPDHCRRVRRDEAAFAIMFDDPLRTSSTGATLSAPEIVMRSTNSRLSASSFLRAMVTKSTAA